MKNLKTKAFKSTKGITLIALVVTIIILLILAGVSIAMLTGNNGVLTQGKRAKEETEIAEEKEAISLAMNALKIQKQVGAKESGRKVALNNEPKEEVLDAQCKDVIKLSATSTNSIVITPEELKEEMDKGNPKPESVTQGDDDGLEVTFGADRKNRAYDVTQAGVITKKAQLTPEEAAKIVDIVTNIDGVTYVLTAGGEVKATTVTPGNIFGTLKTTDEVITKNGVKKKCEDWFIDKKGKVYTWGSNSYGQLGNGSETTTYTSVPICISEVEDSPLKGKNIVDIYGSSTMIARDSDGKLYSWGYNKYGELGNGTTANSSMPICISDIENSTLKGKNIVDIYGGGSTMIAKDSNGKLYSWGYNYGRLGNGTTDDSSMPICISDIEGSTLKGKNIVDVYYNTYKMIAKDSNGKLYSWGDNDYGQLGDGTTTDSSMPICISDIENSPLREKNIIDVYGGFTVIAKDSSGKLYTWGENDYGQLGDGTTTNSSMPICISDIENSPLREKNIVKIYREENSIIVKDSSGKLYTWGENDYGQLGDGTTTNSSMPICISDMENSPLNGKDIVDVYNDFGIIAKSSDGKLYSWGNNSSTIICVNDMQDSPLKGKNVVDIYYGYGTIMAKDSNGKLYSWGGNGYGQLGDGTRNNSNIPICISDVENSELKGKKIKNVEYNSYNNGIYHNSFEVYYYVTENGEYYEYIFTPIQ